jgi:hypothetical protein
MIKPLQAFAHPGRTRIGERMKKLPHVKTAGALYPTKMTPVSTTRVHAS